MSHRKLIKQLEHLKIEYYGTVTNADTAMGYSMSLATLLKEASAFYIDGKTTDFPKDEILASAAAMDEAGVFRSPAHLVYIETNSVIGGELAVTPERHSRVGFLIDSIGQENEAIPNCPCIIAAFLKDSSWPTNAWLIIPSSRPLGLHAMDQTIFVPPWLELTDRQKNETHRAMMSMGEFCHTSLIVLLATRGIETEYVPHRKKMDLKHRAEPVDGYTIVHVHRAMQRQHQGGVAGERHRVRLHMRAGHGRKQRYGPRLVHMRRIWIEPTLIGYEEEGRIDHDYRIHNPEDPMGDHPDA